MYTNHCLYVKNEKKQEKEKQVLLKSKKEKETTKIILETNTLKPKNQ